MPQLDGATGLLTMPWWIAAAVAGCALLFGVLAILREGAGRTLLGLAAAGVLAFVLALGWTMHERSALRERDTERRALDVRMADLALRAAAPGSPLACLAAPAGETVEAACGETLFASPENVAAAVAYAQAHLDLLRDAAGFAARGNDYERALAALRRPAEADRFGLFAQVFAARDNCTAERCEAAVSLLRERARILANLKEGRYQAGIDAHSVRWARPSGAALAATPVLPAPAAPAVTSSVDFPSAASIPPVSIMNNEPGMPGQNGVDSRTAAESRSEPKPDKPAAPPRRAAAKKPAEKPAPAEAAARAAVAPGPPVPIAPQRPPAADAEPAPR